MWCERKHFKIKIETYLEEADEYEYNRSTIGRIWSILQGGSRRGSRFIEKWRSHAPIEKGRDGVCVWQVPVWDLPQRDWFRRSCQRALCGEYLWWNERERQLYFEWGAGRHLQSVVKRPPVWQRRWRLGSRAVAPERDGYHRGDCGSRSRKIRESDFYYRTYCRRR